MKKYYPLLSVGVAVVLLILPVVLLGHSSADESGPSKEILSRDLEDLKGELSSVSSQLANLKEQLAALQETDKSLAAKRVDESKRAAQAKAQQEAAEEEQVAIQSKLDEVQRQLASLIAAKEKPVNPIDPGDHVAMVDVPRISLVPADDPNTAMVSADDERDHKPVVATLPPVGKKPKIPLLTPEQLAALARNNLNERTEPGKKAPAAVGEIPTLDELQKRNNKPEVKRVDMVLQQPREDVAVGRTEQLYAYTDQPGWPVVLVRANLDNEEWWAQQVVGRRGNLIGAHVNFGSGKTPRGSAFRLVIMLLDSEEEAVRFRTARRFNEVPKGIRHSREFVFVLN